jgi:hypothetical protein
MNAPMPACLTTLPETLFAIQGPLVSDDPVEYKQDPYLVPAKDLAPIDDDILSEVLSSPGPKGSEILAAMQLTNHTSKEVGLMEWQGYLCKHHWPEGFEGLLANGKVFRIFNTPTGYGVILRGKPSRYFVSTFC